MAQSSRQVAMVVLEIGCTRDRILHVLHGESQNWKSLSPEPPKEIRATHRGAVV